MASLKAKIKLSTALAFSAAVGVALPTALVPAVAVAESVTAEDFAYPEITPGKQSDKALVDALYRLVPTFKGGDEGSTTWSLPDNLTPFQKSQVRLDKETGVLEVPGMASEILGNSFKVIATRDGKSFEVPVSYEYTKDIDTTKFDQLTYPLVPSYFSHSSAGTSGPVLIRKGSDKHEPALGSYEFDKDSMFWDDSYDSIFALDENTGAISYKSGPVVGPLSVLGYMDDAGKAPTPSVFLPVKASVEGIDIEDTLVVRFGGDYLFRDLLPLGIDSVSLNSGESTTSNLYLNVSPDAFDPEKIDDPAPREKFGWENGKTAFKIPEDFLDGVDNILDQYGFKLTEPDFPRWIEYDSDTKTATVKPDADVKPGEYVFNFKYSYSVDKEKLDQALHVDDLGETGISHKEYGEEAVVPFKVTISGPETVATSSSISYPDTDAVVGSDGIIEPVIEGEASDFAFDTESADWDASVTEWSTIDPNKGTLTFTNLPALPEGKDAWIIPVKATVDGETIRTTARIVPKAADEGSTESSGLSTSGNDALPGSEGESSLQDPVAAARQVLASTGANVTTLIALGLLASLAGAALLLYRRRSTSS